jgi:hypothetical protein
MGTMNVAERVEVHVKSLVTGEKANFPMTLDATVQRAWDESYTELKEARRDGDTFRCADGTDLMSKLDLTLAQVREEKVCDGERFEIRGRSGGA